MTRKRDDNSKDTGKVVVLHPEDSEGDKRSFTRRWGGKVADHGYTMVPHMFFSLQAKLDLTCPQAMVLLHLLDHWWYTESLPWPSKRLLANRLSMSERQVQRLLTDLEKEGLIKRKARYHKSGGQQSNAYDLKGLVERLKELEPAFTKARQEINARRDGAERPARRRRAGTPRSASSSER